VGSGPFRTRLEWGGCVEAAPERSIRLVSVAQDTVDFAECTMT